jgi:thiamine-phosphate pyrophosphorylase
MIEQGLYFITDSTLTHQGVLEDTHQALQAGVKTVQFREKKLPMSERYPLALALKRLCHHYGAKLIINDGIDLALAIKADGIHIGQEDMPFQVCKNLVGNKMLIGLSTHSLAQAKEAKQLGADYIGFGPLFSSSTKPEAGEGKGIQALAKIVKQIDLPIVAIGGIKQKNLPDIVKTGVSNIAIISEIITATSLPIVLKQIIEEIK